MDKRAIPIVVIIVVLVIGGVLVVSNTSKPAVAPPVPSPLPTETLVIPTAQTTEIAPSTILVTDAGFSPSSLTVPVGTEVTWTNQTSKTVNVSSADHPTHTKYPPMNLGNFAAGQSVTLTFDTVGEYRYHNHLNASQTGVIKVVLKE